MYIYVHAAFLLNFILKNISPKKLIKDGNWYYLLVAILKKELKIDRSLYEILQVLSVNIFERTQVNQLFTEFDYKSYKDEDRQALLL